MLPLNPRRTKRLPASGGLRTPSRPRPACERNAGLSGLPCGNAQRKRSSERDLRDPPGTRAARSPGRPITRSADHAVGAGLSAGA